MPAAAKTSDDAIVRAAREAVERGGGEFSMVAVADAVGVRPASLYKRFRDRDALASRVRADAYRSLGAAIGHDAAGSTGIDLLRSMAAAYVAFARAHPRIYHFLFVADDDPEVHAARVASVAPVMAALRPIAGDEALNAARTVTAFLHGYVSMSLAGAFQLGGDPDAALAFGLELFLRALTEARPSEPA